MPQNGEPRHHSTAIFLQNAFSQRTAHYALLLESYVYSKMGKKLLIGNFHLFRTVRLILKTTRISYLQLALRISRSQSEERAHPKSEQMPDTLFGYFLRKNNSPVPFQLQITKSRILGAKQYKKNRPKSRKTSTHSINFLVHSRKTDFHTISNTHHQTFNRWSQRVTYCF